MTSLRNILKEILALEGSVRIISEASCMLKIPWLSFYAIAATAECILNIGQKKLGLIKNVAENYS